MGGFEWDRGNQEKNELKYNVTNKECEEVFFDEQKKILKDPLHSGKEQRYILLGKTKTHRHLFIVVTVRKLYMRIISARDLNKKEYPLYEKET